MEYMFYTIISNKVSFIFLAAKKFTLPLHHSYEEMPKWAGHVVRTNFLFLNFWTQRDLRTCNVGKFSSPTRESTTVIQKLPYNNLAAAIPVSSPGEKQRAGFWHREPWAGLCLSCDSWVGFLENIHLKTNFKHHTSNIIQITSLQFNWENKSFSKINKRKN